MGYRLTTMGYRLPAQASHTDTRRKLSSPSRKHEQCHPDPHGRTRHHPVGCRWVGVMNTLNFRIESVRLTMGKRRESGR